MRTTGSSNALGRVDVPLVRLRSRPRRLSRSARPVDSPPGLLLARCPRSLGSSSRSPAITRRFSAARPHRRTPHRCQWVRHSGRRTPAACPVGVAIEGVPSTSTRTPWIVGSDEGFARSPRCQLSEPESVEVTMTSRPSGRLCSRSRSESPSLAPHVAPLEVQRQVPIRRPWPLWLVAWPWSFWLAT